MAAERRSSKPLILVCRETDKLVPDPRNARTHAKRQVDQIVASIQEFGFTNPILIDPEGTIIAGHGRLKTYLGRVFRDVCRKIDGHLDLAARLSVLLGLVERLLAQKPDDSNKLYALHAPEVVCISKGKAHKRYEFGCKVGIAATNREGLFIAAMAFEGNPYDGHTLKASAAKTETRCSPLPATTSGSS